MHEICNSVRDYYPAIRSPDTTRTAQGIYQHGSSTILALVKLKICDIYITSWQMFPCSESEGGFQTLGDIEMGDLRSRGSLLYSMTA